LRDAYLTLLALCPTWFFVLLQKKLKKCAKFFSPVLPKIMENLKNELAFINFPVNKNFANDKKVLSDKKMRTIKIFQSSILSTDQQKN
jgi:hypothetical protein